MKIRAKVDFEVLKIQGNADSPEFYSTQSTTAPVILCHGAFEWDTISTKPLVLFYYGFNVVMGLVVMVGGIYVSVAELTAGAANAGGAFAF